MVHMQYFETSRRSLLALSPRLNSKHPSLSQQPQAARHPDGKPRELQMGEKQRPQQHS